MGIGLGIADLEGVGRPGGQVGELRGGPPLAVAALVLRALDGFQGDAGVGAVCQFGSRRGGLGGLGHVDGAGISILAISDGHVHRTDGIQLVGRHGIARRVHHLGLAVVIDLGDHKISGS